MQNFLFLLTTVLVSDRNATYVFVLYALRGQRQVLRLTLRTTIHKTTNTTATKNKHIGAIFVTVKYLHIVANELMPVLTSYYSCSPKVILPYTV